MFNIYRVPCIGLYWILENRKNANFVVEPLGLGSPRFLNFGKIGFGKRVYFMGKFSKKWLNFTKIRLGFEV